MYTLKEWFLRWLFSWGRLLDGVIGVVTLATIQTDFALRAAKKLSRFRMKHRMEKDGIKGN